MKLHDQHVHTHFSFDSDETLEKYLDRASELGLEYFVFTDHCDLNYLHKGKDLFFDIDKRNEEIKRLNKIYPNINILNGIEIGYQPSELNRINDILSNYKFDLVNFSLHEANDIDFYLKDEFIKFGIDNVLNIYFDNQITAIKEFDNFDVLCHLDYGFKTAYLLDNSLSIKKYEDKLTEIMKILIQKEKALEINIKVQSVLPVEHTKYILNLYKNLGGRILTISSDSHSADRLNKDFEYYINIVKECGFTHLSYFIDRNRSEILI